MSKWFQCRRKVVDVVSFVIVTMWMRVERANQKDVGLVVQTKEGSCVVRTPQTK